jgi:phosphoribosyl-ATP pyrophosphohydrolase/phosphoribosyl-AMP cyclohydrolase/histidinol dehydrogenase
VERRHGQGALPRAVLEKVERTLEEIKGGGPSKLLAYCQRYRDLAEGERLFLERGELQSELERLSTRDRERLERIRNRIRRFAEAQLEAFRETTMALPGGEAGHTLTPVERAGCYAPGGRYPLPSSVLMTAVTATVAGVREVIVASPRPTRLTLAAAALAGARGLLAAGGAHAIGALAWGTESTGPCDVIAGPGNVYVSAAKKLLAGEVAIDMLAGPSEVVILADRSASPALVAADLLAQAEHAPDALALLVTPSADLIEAVETELERQLASLPTAEIARRALEGSAAVSCSDLSEAIGVCDRLAPEHLQVLIDGSESLETLPSQYGGIFLGESTPTALGDYGAGPNHVLPTGGTARFGGGLSVLAFLRVRGWLRIDDPAAASELYEDAAWLARQEGLEAHARSAEARGYRSESDRSHRPRRRM